MRHIYTKEFLKPLIQESKSWAEVARRVGVTFNTGTQTHIKKRSIDFGIDYSHFTGKAWNRGQTFIPKCNSEFFIENGTTQSNRVRKQLFKRGLKEKRCEVCNRTNWNKKEIPLEVDHINGIKSDNRLINLRIICPNCHAQTPTYKSKNRGHMMKSANIEDLKPSAREGL